MENKTDNTVWESSDVNHDQPCQLHCHPAGVPGHTLPLPSHLVDGTVCGEGKLGVCLGGQCEVGVTANSIIRYHYFLTGGWL